jgi:hypothetical protein
VVFVSLAADGACWERSSCSVRLVHCFPFHQRMVFGWPVGSGYQPAGGLLIHVLASLRARMSTPVHCAC